MTSSESELLLLQPPFVNQALSLADTDAGVRLGAGAKRFIAVTALLVGLVAALASIVASVIVCNNHVSRRVPSSKEHDVRLLYKQALDAAAAARQDANVGLAVAHAHQAVAYLRALELIASPGQVERILGLGDFSAVASLIRATQDEVLHRATAVCPALDPTAPPPTTPSAPLHAGRLSAP